ncbi:MAG: hypothetical protein U0905_22440 [Pirellulales bacterium]
MTRKSTHVRRMSLEALESRELKAGNVSVSVVNEELRVVGDNNANQIEIHQSVGNIYKVTGLNGTKINGKEDKLFSFKGGISVDLKGGDDKFVMGGVLFNDDVHGNLNVTMGAGKDKVILGKVNVQGTTTINTDNDADQVTLDGSYRTLNVNTGAGDDIVNTSTMLANNFNLNLGAGADSTKIEFSNIDNLLDIQASTEADSITLNHAFSDRIRIDSGAGKDSVLLKNQTQSNDLRVNTGADADTVEFNEYGPFGGTVSVDTADGDDIVRVKNSFINNNAEFKTGSGNDQVLFETVQVAGNLRIETANGKDTIDLTKLTLSSEKDITILTGDDDDIVRFNQVIADELFADLGKDRDEFRLRDTTLRVANINGGNNTDKFFDLLGNHITTLNVVDFEQLF